jgi:predicted SnoaL-like aldol condensation-catalyzing enzyme
LVTDRPLRPLQFGYEAAPLRAQATATEQLAAQVEQPRDLAREEANRQLVVEFYDRFFNKHEATEAAKVIADDYIQHNPSVPDGKKPFLSFFTGYFHHNPNAQAKIVRSVASGDLVWLHVNATDGSGKPGVAVVDIFRVKDGMIVEHWDVVQSVPERAANKNTMF